MARIGQAGSTAPGAAGIAPGAGRVVPAGRAAAARRRGHVRGVLVLGLPLMASHLAQMAIHVTDTLMLGRYDVAALAAATLATSLFFVIFIVGSGFAMAVMPMVAEARAAGDDVRLRRVTRMGMWVSILYGAAFLPGIWFAESVLLAIGQTPEVAALGGNYLRIAGVLGLIPQLLIMVLKSHLSALERTRPVLLATLAAAAANVPLNYALIFGRWGAPELGIEGAAIASVTVTAIALVWTGIAAARATSGPALYARLWRVDGEALGAVVRLGWPIGLTMLAESGLFTASAIMMGWLGTVPLAAHGIAIQITALAFIVHVGLSQAATIRAGAALGARDRASLATGARVALGVSAGIVACAATTFWLVPEWLIGLFLRPGETEAARIVGLGVTLLTVAAIFQIADAMQVMTLGLLRGVQDTRAPMVIAVLAYWAVGMPAGWALAFPLGLGPVGIWAGLATGLGLAAALLSWRFWAVMLPRI